jgi:glycosyltransferase involved in cell wall biosynthesis
MRLGYLIPEWPANTHAFFWQEVEALKDMGVDVRVISTRRPPPGSCAHPFANRAMEETHYLYPPRGGEALATLGRRPRKALAATRYLSRLSDRRLAMMGLLPCAADLLRFSRRHRLDHLHIHSCANSAHLGALCRRLGGPTYSLTLHGDLPVYGSDHDKKMAGASFVATVTRPLQEQVMAATGLPEEKVPVLCMGVDTDQFVPGPQRLAARWQLRLLTTARLQVAKGHKHLLRGIRVAVDRGCDVRYTIAGAGADRDGIVEEIAGLNLSDRVELVGAVSHDQLLQLLRNHDAFALPSVGIGEAAPVAVMEAMSCGLPVICSMIGGTPDMITHNHDGLLVKQYDETGLGAAVEFLAGDVEARQRLGRAARQRAVQAFDYRRTTGRLLDVLRYHVEGAVAIADVSRRDGVNQSSAEMVAS